MKNPDISNKTVNAK